MYKMRAVLSFCLLLFASSSQVVAAEEIDYAEMRANQTNGSLFGDENLIRDTVPDCACSLLDIVLVIDSSESITHLTFLAVKNFCAALVSGFLIAPNAVRVSGIYYNDKVQASWPLEKYNQITPLIRAILQTGYTVGETNTASALLTADAYLSHQRANVPNAILFFSDGRHNVGEDPVPVADAIRAAFDTTIIAVGVPGVNGFLKPIGYDELLAITGSPAKVFNVTDLNNMSAILPDVEKLLPCTCQSTTTSSTSTTTTTPHSTTTSVASTSTIASNTTTTTTTVTPTSSSTTTLSTSTTSTTTLPSTTTAAPCVCSCIDLIMAIDASESIQLNFDQILNFTRDFIDLFNVSQREVRFAVILYNDGVLTESWDFKKYNDQASLDKAVEALKALSALGLTNTTAALERAISYYEADSRHVERAMILMTDGKSDAVPASDPCPVAKLLREQEKVRIISVGVPGRSGAIKPVDEAELECISGDKQYVFNISKIVDLQAFKDTLVRQLPCDCDSVCVTECECCVDIAVVLEVTELDGDVVAQLLKLVREAADNLFSSISNARMALVLFSSAAKSKVVFTLDQGTDITTVGQLLDAIAPDDYKDGITDLNTALQLVNNSVFVPGEDRSGAANYVLLVADGFYDNEPACCDPPFAIAQQLRTKAQIFAVKLASTTADDEKTLLQIVGGDQTSIYNTLDFMDKVPARIEETLPPKCQSRSTSSTRAVTTPNRKPVQNGRPPIMDALSDESDLDSKAFAVSSLSHQIDGLVILLVLYSAILY